MENLEAYIFIDASNMHYYLRKKGWRIDWVKFKNYCKSSYKNPYLFYYEGVPSKGQYFDNHPDDKISDFNKAKNRKLNYFKYLRQNDYRVRHKPVTRVYDNTSGEFKHKCNFDVELTIDAIDNINIYELFILVSGDGDFVKLIKYLKGKKKKTLVIAPGDRLSWNLEKAANKVIYIDDLKKDIVQ